MHDVCVCVCVHVSGVRVCGEMHIKYGKYSLNVLLECNNFHASYKVHIITSIAHTHNYRPVHQSKSLIKVIGNLVNTDTYIVPV